MYMSVFSMQHIHTCCPGRPEKGVNSPGKKVTDSCELPNGYWEPNPGLLYEPNDLKC